MARLPRLVVPHQPHHVIQKGISGQLIFRKDEDFQVFLKWLREAARQFKVALHAYALLSDQVQLLVSPSDGLGLGKMMQWVGRYYVPYFNQAYQRAGTLWQGRFRATVLEAEPYFLLCSRFIELTPVRADLVSDPLHYTWSSYLHHIGVRTDPHLTTHPMYWRLGNTPFEREAAYKRLMDQGLSSAETRALEEATNKAWALGSSQFKAELEKQIQRRVQPAKRGRPRKTQSEKPD